MCRRWEKALNTHSQQNGHVCELHFRPEDIFKVDLFKLPGGTVHCHTRLRSKLKKNAIPFVSQLPYSLMEPIKSMFLKKNYILFGVPFACFTEP